MKQPHFILSLVIPGPSRPGNDIDVYLRPLIEELKELWAEGADTYDSFKKETFKLRAAVLWTNSDFPGLAMLSGWSTKGKLACPTCQKGTSHRRLKHGGKECYMGHRRWLPPDHKFRDLKKEFDGTVEHDAAPVPLQGREIVRLLKDIPHKFGKKPEEPEQPEENDASAKKKKKGQKGKTPRVKKKRPREEEESVPFPDNWKKLSIMFELPY